MLFRALDIPCLDNRRVDRPRLHIVTDGKASLLTRGLFDGVLLCGVVSVHGGDEVASVRTAKDRMITIDRVLTLKLLRMQRGPYEVSVKSIFDSTAKVFHKVL